MTRLVIVGNGHAAHRLTAELHRRGFPGSVTVLGAEPVAAYNRVMLPSVLAGTLPGDALTLPDPPPGVRVRPGVTVLAVDRSHREVLGSDGRRHPYDLLVLATGARPVVPALPGIRHADGTLATSVRTIRSLADCSELTAGPVVVLGAGVLGVEVATALQSAGHDVTVVHRHAHPMNRELDAAGGHMLERHLRQAGLPLILQRRAVGLEAGRLVFDDGSELPAGTLLLCTGATPDTSLARDAGLIVRCGVTVGGDLRTSDRRIFAIGDCAEHDGVVSVQVNGAWEQAGVLAAVLCGEPALHRPGPRVTRLRTGVVDVATLDESSPQTLAPGTHTVRLSDPERGRYALLRLRGDRVEHAVLVGLPRAISALSQLHDAGSPVPAGRMGVLLGVADQGADVFELPDEAVICVCNNVTRRALIDAWHDGAHDLPALAAATRATSGCGRCAGGVRRVRDALTPVPDEKGTVVSAA